MSKKHQNILVVRFSAMGDVVLTVPVIKNLLDAHPKSQIYVLSKPFFKSFFDYIPQVTFIGADLKGIHKGFFGLRRLVNQLHQDYDIDMVIDLHSVIRSWIIGFLFRLKRIPVYRINKGRKAKKQFVKYKKRPPLKHTTERYQDVFTTAGLSFEFNPQYLIKSNHKNDTPIIGIAPFAAHQSKAWGTAKIYELIERIDAKYTVQFYLFGGGTTEVEQLNLMASYYPNVINMAGTMSLSEEIKTMSALSAFICMDSGNMHISTLTDIPVISIWGGTHPDIGFKALYQPDENNIQLPVDSLPCRPCSVFGTKDCQLKDKPFACMTNLGVERVIERLETLKVL